MCPGPQTYLPIDQGQAAYAIFLSVSITVMTKIMFILWCYFECYCDINI